MKTPEIRLRSSIARPSDNRLVARLCRRAVGPRDYVLAILREVVADKGLFLAWNGEMLVGMTNFETCVDGSGWLSMARTDLQWRRSGVALFLQRQIAAHARQRGVKILRLWTSSKNKPSVRACRKGGFNPVCEAAHTSCRLRPKRRKPVTRPISPRSEAPLKSFLRFTYLSKMNGYLAYKWHFVKASRELLEQLLRRKELYKVGDSWFILTKPERSYRTLESSCTILSGPIASSLRSAIEVAEGLGAQTIGAYIPYDSFLIKRAIELGFRREPWGEHSIVFEKRLRNAPRAPAQCKVI